MNTSFPFPDRIETKWEIEKKRNEKKEDGKVNCSMGWLSRLIPHSHSQTELS